MILLARLPQMLRLLTWSQKHQLTPLTICQVVFIFKQKTAYDIKIARTADNQLCRMGIVESESSCTHVIKDQLEPLEFLLSFFRLLLCFISGIDNHAGNVALGIMRRDKRMYEVTFCRFVAWIRQTNQHAWEGMHSILPIHLARQAHDCHTIFPEGIGNIFQGASLHISPFKVTRVTGINSLDNQAGAT